MRHQILSALLLAMLSAAAPAASIETEKRMLSGGGPADAVPWDFTIDGGMRAGEKTTIAVPSNWQQQGFGHYQYGYDRARQSHDRAIYHRRFEVPRGWIGKTIRLVFDGVMTDALVRVNGIVAGPLHQGGFNRFGFDVTTLVKPGEANDLTVEVSEASSAVDTNIAERQGDYWAFGGIYRPVWIEALPAQAIAHVAIDGRASGDVRADVRLAAPHDVTRVVGQVVDTSGKPVGTPFSEAIPAGGTGTVTLHGRIDAPRLWTAETPNLYALDVTLLRGDEAVHHVRTRFGFRTFEVRAGEGLFLNGQKIILRGVNRHSFRPETGRALNPADAYADVRLIRGMNMNAVRMSHYSPEESLLEAADELGLYVLDELSGWQHAHGTEVGRRLVRELVDRDVNHPSILFWDNGNEGGFNRELDGEFALFDPQDRKILHPWEMHDGIDTKHYPNYADFLRRLRGPNLFMPTEFQHGLFDGGAGAGLDDYWQALRASPYGAGGFIWSFADEGVARTDQAGRIDNFGSFAPDGIVGPHHEPEPSYFTIRDIWSPVQIAAPILNARFDGRLVVTNQYDFTASSALRLCWEWIKFANPLAAKADAAVLLGGDLAGPTISPHATGALTLPVADRPADADALRVTATREGALVSRWVWPVAPARAIALPRNRSAVPLAEHVAGGIRLSAGRTSATFDPTTGLLRTIGRNGRSFGIGNGPRLVFARPAAGEPAWRSTSWRSGVGYVPAAAGPADSAEVDIGLTAEEAYATFALELSPDGQVWHTVFDGTRTFRDKSTYTFPPQQVAAIRVTGLRSLRGTVAVRGIRLGYAADRYAAATLRPVAVTYGQGVDPATGKAAAWLDAPGAGGLERARWTLSASGTLRLSYAYRLSGPMIYHGIGFDADLEHVARIRSLIRGPWPVWKNRLRGPELGVHDLAEHGRAGALSPEHAGYFADPRWVRLDTKQASLVVRPSPGTAFLQLGAKLAGYPTTSPDFPPTAIGFLQAIPAIGNKFNTPDQIGPESAVAVSSGTYAGSVDFDLFAVR